MKSYPLAYDENGSSGHAVALLGEVGASRGVVLDLGSGPGAVAEAVRDLGLEYVGCDVDAVGLDDLRSRGFESHELDLLAEEATLLARLRQVLDGRPLAAVLALDVLEHLVDPVAVLRAVRTLAVEADCPLVVSIPNVTHADVAAKVALGRWDVDDSGLLDDTHLRFFSELELGRLLVSGGWVEDGRHDVVAELSDQCFPVDAPTLRPGAPLRELLRQVRLDADGAGLTYQFLRRLRPGPEPAEAPHQSLDSTDRPLLGALVVAQADGDAEGLLGDLAAQAPPLDQVEVVGTVAEAIERLADWPTRLVTVLDDRSRLAPGWSAAVVDAVRGAPGRVLEVPCVVVPDSEWTSVATAPGERWADDPGARPPSETHPFDPLFLAPPAPIVEGSCVVPVEVLATAGVTPDAGDGPAALAVWLARVAQLSGATRLGGPPLIAVAAATTAATPAAHAAIDARLDERALVFSPGSASRLADARRRVVAAEAATAELGARVAAAEHRAEALAHHLRVQDAELVALRPELEALRAEHARRPSRRLVAWLRRLVG